MQPPKDRPGRPSPYSKSSPMGRKFTRRAQKSTNPQRPTPQGTPNAGNAQNPQGKKTKGTTRKIRASPSYLGSLGRCDLGVPCGVGNCGVAELTPLTFTAASRTSCARPTDRAGGSVR